MNNNICKTSVINGGEISPLIIPKELTEGTGLTNPSILRVDGKLMLNIRHVQYALYHSEKNQKFQSPYGSLVYLNPEDDITLTTRNFLCELNPITLEISNVNEVDTSEMDKKPLWEFVGLEDARLVNWDDKTILTGVRRDTTTNGEGRMELSEIVDFKEVSRSRIEPPKDSYCEKNWMPILDMPNHYVKWTNPTEIVKVDPIKKTSETVKLVKQKVDFKRDLRGGSQVVKYKDYWVALTHEVDLWNDERGAKDAQYYHRFIVWDKDWNIVKYSDEFKFMDAQIEFSCGLHIENGNLFIPFGFQDTSAYILRMPTDVFESMVGLSDVDLCNLDEWIIKEGSLINSYINNPESPLSNYNLAFNYYNLGQFASSISFFLRTAELENSSKELVYESLLYLASSLNKLGRREGTEIALWHNAIRYNPSRPEAYLFVSQYYEARKRFSEAQAYAKIGLNFKDNVKSFNNNLGYHHYYQLEFQDALCDWNLGQFNSARIKFRNLAFSKYPLNDLYKELIQKNVTSLGSSADPFLPYDASMQNRLRYKFKGSNKIEKNFSQTFQDMFVLSMLDGKKNGTYLEIGAADPFYGSNTALLEQFGWSGTSLEILEQEVERFKAHRKNEVILCDATKFDYSTLNGYIDYLQVDCEPPATTYYILTQIPFDKVDFGVITYEHDHYTDMEAKHRELSREFLISRGYVLVVGNIAPDNVSAYEDWYVHPKYIKEKTLRLMLDESDKVQKASDYMLKK